MRLMLILAGAAFAISTAAAAAGPSSRADREATRLLNMEQMQKAEAANVSLRPKVTDAAANNPMNSPPAAAPTTKVATAPIAAPAP